MGALGRSDSAFLRDSAGRRGLRFTDPSSNGRAGRPIRLNVSATARRPTMAIPERPCAIPRVP